jgi:leucyl/phenylalanyl-tRNA--protein transferase
VVAGPTRRRAARRLACDAIDAAKRDALRRAHRHLLCRRHSSRESGWITGDFIEAFTALHELGWAHSVEAFDRDGRLAGGLYGVRINGLFAGESMFHRQRDASKVALMALVAQMRETGMSLLDVQWRTDHLASLGAIEVGRSEYLALLAEALGDRLT